MNVRPRALVFDLYGEYFRYTGGAAKLAALTMLMGEFGVEASTVRVVMARLRKEGWFDSIKTGREVAYLLNDKSWHLLEQGRTRIFERRVGDWDRVWTQVLVDRSGTERTLRAQLDTTLQWLGFGCFQGDVWFSPHDREKQLRTEVSDAAGLEITIVRSRTGSLPADRSLAERCWDLHQLGEDYTQFIREYTPRLSHFRHGAAGAIALRERLELVRSYRHYPFRDPDLPDALLPSDWSGQRAHQLFLDCHEALRDQAEAYVRFAGTDQDSDPAKM